MGKRKLSPKLSNLQKRARDKEYRMRKSGISARDVPNLSPRLPASDVMNMTSRERSAYSRKLESFLSRNVQFVALESGEGVRRDVLERTQKYAEKYNKRAERMRERIDRAKAPKGVGTIVDRLRLTGATNPVTGKVEPRRGMVQGSIGELRIAELPTTRAQAMKRLETVKAMAERSYKERREGLRKSVHDMASKLGDDELAERINYMSDIDFDVLVNRTNFMDTLSFEYWTYMEELFLSDFQDKHDTEYRVTMEVERTNVKAVSILDKFGVPKAGAGIGERAAYKVGRWVRGLSE